MRGYLITANKLIITDSDPDISRIKIKKNTKEYKISIYAQRVTLSKPSVVLHFNEEDLKTFVSSIHSANCFEFHSVGNIPYEGFYVITGC